MGWCSLLRDRFGLGGGSCRGGSGKAHVIRRALVVYEGARFGTRRLEDDEVKGAAPALRRR